MLVAHRKLPFRSLVCIDIRLFGSDKHVIRHYPRFKGLMGINFDGYGGYVQGLSRQFYRRQVAGVRTPLRLPVSRSWSFLLSLCSRYNAGTRRGCPTSELGITAPNPKSPRLWYRIWCRFLLMHFLVQSFGHVIHMAGDFRRHVGHWPGMRWHRSRVRPSP